jgi:RNA polymerase sigma-70 factor (ECF subfamily)
MTGQVHDLVTYLFREQAGKINAALLNLFGFDNLQLVEDVVQETFVAAYQTWPYKGIPDDPAAWLIITARNRAINELKRGAKTTMFGSSAFIADIDQYTEQQIDHNFSKKETTDSQLKLLFLCCHPQLQPKAQVILTLQVLCGFSLEEIGNALLMQKEAVKKTLFRTKQAIREKQLYNHTNYTFLSDNRVDTVMQVLYLMFNEGYKTTEDKNLINKDLCYEAVRLCKLLLRLKHKEADINALLALMFFGVARFPARAGKDDEIILLEYQDRTKWDNRFIAEGFYYLEHSRTAQTLTRYHLEAAIASAHCSSKSYEETDWKTIVYYYDNLVALNPSPVVYLNRAIAIAELAGPHEGLKELHKLSADPAVTGYYLYPAAKGELLLKLKQYNEAIPLFRLASDLTRSVLNKNFISSRIEYCIKKLNAHELLQ